MSENCRSQGVGDFFLTHTVIHKWHIQLVSLCVFVSCLDWHIRHAMHGYYRCNSAFTAARYILRWTPHMAANHYLLLPMQHCLPAYTGYFKRQNSMKYHWNDFSILACLLLYSYCTIICNGKMATAAARISVKLFHTVTARQKDINPLTLTVAIWLQL